MDWLKLIMSACGEIWSYKINLSGYNVSIVQVFVFGFLAYVAFKFVSWFT